MIHFGSHGIYRLIRPVKGGWSRDFDTFLCKNKISYKKIRKMPLAYYPRHMV